MAFRCENLEIWKQSRIFNSKIYRITSTFPKSELFALTDQIRRAAISIILNITERSVRKSDKEFICYLRMAITSLEEVVTVLYIALDQEFINQKDFDNIYYDANMLVARINALVNTLKKQ